MMTTSPSGLAIVAFVIFAVVALGVAFVASRRLKTRSDYYTAGGSISAGRNALALAGDFISAGGFLGLTGLIAQHGIDAALYAIGVLGSWPLMLLLFAAPLKKLGRYTLADVIAERLGSERLRLVTAINQIVVIVLGLTSNLVGAFVILRLLFGLSPAGSLLSVGAVLLVYVLIGGMLAATWLQIIKAVLLMIVSTILLALCLAQFGFDPDQLLGAVVARHGWSVLEPGAMYHSAADTSSLVLGLAFGGASMPHVLMRMNTVADPAAARRSAFLATGLLVLFHIILVMIGLAAMALLDPTAGVIDKGGNMTLPLLARQVGGDALLGVVSAIAFTTLLAVMAGQCIAGSAAISHDIWGRLGRGKGSQGLTGSRVASCGLLAVALAFAYVLRAQNIGYIAAASLSIAACANFPTLVLVLFWRGLTAPGAIAGMITGVVGSIALIALSPLVQTNLLGIAHAPFPLAYPTLVAAPASALVAILVSLASGGRRASAPPFRASLWLASIVPVGLLSIACAAVYAKTALSHRLLGNATVYCALLAAGALAVLAIAWLDYRRSRLATGD